VEKAKTEADLSLEEINLLADGIYRFGATPDTLKNFTLKEIIESQRKLIHDNALNALLNRAILTETNNNYGVKYIDMLAKDSDTTYMNQLIIELINFSKNDIKSIQGHLQYFNLNNQIVKQFPLVYSNIIKAGQAIRVTQGYLHDPKSERDIIIREQKSVLRALWQPEILEFANGRKLVLKVN
jgi:nitrogen regulatory protein PII-like uncharacterized protein